MRRILFTFLGRPVQGYLVMLYFAMVLGIYAQLLAARSIGVDMGAALAATLIVAAIALFGSRLLQHAARNFDFFCHHRARHLRDRGLAIGRGRA
jgi:hypothetical protein